MISARPFRTVRARIGAAVVAFLFVLTGTQGYLLVQQQSIAQSLALTTRGYLPLVKIVGRIDQNRERAEREVARITRGETRPVSTPPASVIFNEDLQRDIGEGRIHLRYARTLATTAEERAYLNRVGSQLSSIEDAFREWQRLSEEYATLASDSSSAAADLQKPLGRQGAHLADEVETLTRLVDARFASLTAETERAQARTAAVAAGFTILAALVGGILVAITSFALAPIGRLTTQVQRLAAGDIGNRVEVRGSDEVADLAAEFNAMLEALQTRDRTLKERADQLNKLSTYLTSVLDNLDDALFVMEDGKITLSNPAALTRWGAEVGAALPPALLNGPGRQELDVAGHHYDIRRSNFGPSGSVWTIADITDQIRTRDRLARSERLALIGQMLAQVTHEVRNPLNALSLNTELLAEELEKLDPSHKAETWEILATVSGEIERLTLVTAHYLQLARRPAARFSSEDVCALIDDVTRFVAAEFQQDKVEMTVTMSAIGLQVVDANQLKQALLNLLRNAREAGATHVHLAAGPTPEGWFVSIADDGTGFSEDEIARAGEPFYSSKASGTGLGLAITKQIVEDHEGSLHIAPRVEGGSLVTLRFGTPSAIVERNA